MRILEYSVDPDAGIMTCKKKKKKQSVPLLTWKNQDSSQSMLNRCSLLKFYQHQQLASQGQTERKCCPTLNFVSKGFIQENMSASEER